MVHACGSSAKKWMRRRAYLHVTRNREGWSPRARSLGDATQGDRGGISIRVRQWCGMRGTGNGRWNLHEGGTGPEPAGECLDGGTGQTRAQGAFPDDRDPPPGIHQGLPVACIARNIRQELRVPEPGVRRRGGGRAAPIMTVPEAPVDKDHGAMLAQDQIGPARQCPGMQAEAEPRAVQGASHPHLWQGVAPANRRHHARPGSSVNDVWHDRASVSGMAVRDHPVRLVRDGHTAARRPCACASHSPREIACMIVMLRVYILQQIVEVMACQDS